MMPLTRHRLTPAMRSALALAPAYDGLREHFHGSTINALVRAGLASYDGEDAYLTAEGLEERARLRQRADDRLARHGFKQADGSGLGLYTNPDEGGTCTRSGAMRRTGIRW